MVKGDLVEGIGAYDYYLCMTEDCNMVYFFPNNILYRTDLIIPVWFKINAKPKYICYCNKVTQEQIENAVIKQNAKDMKDVIQLTGAMKSAQCIINNPTGKCCGPVIQQIIDSTLHQR